MDLYEFLGVDKEATQKDIKKAYLKLSKVCHPDTEEGSEEKFTELNEAYRILSNKELRKMYDEGGDLEEVKKESNGLVKRVFSIFEEALNSNGFVPDHEDIFKIMRELCNDKELKMKRDIQTVQNEIKNLEAIQFRMKNADIFKAYLDDQKEDNKERIGKIEQEIRYISQVLSFIENCEYEVDEDDEWDIPPRKYKGMSYGI